MKSPREKLEPHLIKNIALITLAERGLDSDGVTALLEPQRLQRIASADRGLYLNLNRIRKEKLPVNLEVLTVARSVHQRHMYASMNFHNQLERDNNHKVTFEW